jgi:ribosomal-protein-alanine N-acetyltransferase
VKKVVGYAHLKPAGEGYDLMYLYVAPEYRRRGIAKEIMNGLINFAEKRGKNITLEVRKSNCNAIDLYTGLGFKKISERKRYYSDGEDAWIMCLTELR